MLFALIAGIVTLIVLTVGVVVFLRRRREGQAQRAVSKQHVNAINTVGVVAEEQSTGFGTKAPVQVPEEEAIVGTPAEPLRGRFVAVAVFAAAVFGSLSAKLWSMQIMQQEEFARKAQQNLFTTVYKPAPRGQIYEYSEEALIKNRSAFTVLADAEVANNRDVIGRLSALLGIPAPVVRQRILNASSGAQNTRVVAGDVSLRNLAFIGEHADAFPGVSCENRTMRVYPYGTLAAHVLGYTGTVSEEELKNVPEGRDIQSGDIVGKNGIEASFDDVLSGDHGSRTMLIDASGNVLQVLSETDPTRGNDVYLTIKGSVQQVADETAANYVIGGACTATAIVCLDVRDGSIVAMANYPTYAPGSFVGGISESVWEEFNTEKSHYPLMNRSIAGAYPAASTFKAFTAMAGLNHHIIDEKSETDCTGIWTGFGDSFPQACWELDGHGLQDVIHGIANSCDSFFYDVGKGFYDHRDELGLTAMQDYIQQFGFGRQTGIDLYGEASGRIPTPEWKAEYFHDAPEEAAWRAGDYTNMVIGQGYVLTTPLQIACGYAGIATGTVYKPHLLKEVRNSFGEVVIQHTPEILYEPHMEEEHIKLVRKGLREVMTLNDYERFLSDDVKYEVAGKTGTAEVFGKLDYSLFACYAPYDDPKYVVATVCEEGPTTYTSSIPMSIAVLEAAMAYDNGTLPKEFQPTHWTTQAADPELLEKRLEELTQSSEDQWGAQGYSYEDVYGYDYSSYGEDYSYAPIGRTD
ncbi:MAG: penicillin-binding protein 2 [Eggerthellaceae bacterium]|nr:penicillin-binding protein 2 [Eggerthellaceae bacterium]